MDRVTPEVILNAYAETGLAPVCQTWINPIGTCACAMTALLVGKDRSCKEEISSLVGNVADPLELFNYFSKNTGLNEEYVEFFIMGYDGESYEDIYPPIDTPESNAGFEDGKAVRIAVSKEYGLGWV